MALLESFIISRAAFAPTSVLELSGIEVFEEPRAPIACGLLTHEWKANGLV